MKIHAQATVNLVTSSTPLAADAVLSASAICQGHRRLCGALYTTGSAAVGAGSGLHIQQGINGSPMFTSASYAITEGVATTFNIDILANTVWLTYYNGHVLTPQFRIVATLYPV